MARTFSYTTPGSGASWEDSGVEVGLGEQVIVQSLGGTASHRVALAVTDTAPTGLVGLQIQNSAGSPAVVTMRGPGTLYVRNVAPATSVVISGVVEPAPASGA